MASKYLIGTGNWSADTIWSTTDGGANDATHPVDGDAVFCTAASGATVLTVDVSSAATSLTCTGFTGTFTGSAALQLKGNLLAVAGMTYSYTGTLTIANTTGTATLTSAGKTLCGNLTQNGAGGTLTFADAFITTGTCTLTAGTWDDGNRNLTMAAWVNTGSTTRVVTFGTSNTWTVTGSGTCWNESGTNLSNNVISRMAGGKDAVTTVDFTYSGASSRTQVSDTALASLLPKVKVSAGSGLFTMGRATGSTHGGVYAHGLDFTGFSGTYAPAATVYVSGSLYYLVSVGDLTLSSTMSLTSVSDVNCTMTISTTRLAGETVYITCNGVSIPLAATANGVWIRGAVSAGSVTLTDNFSTTGRIEINTFGTPQPVTVTANGGVTCSALDASSTNTRTITMGSGTWTLTSTAATTVWNMATTTGLTLNANTAIIDLTGNTTNVRTITANSATLPSIRISGGTGAGSVTLTNVNCNDLIFANTYACTGFANQTITIRGSVTLSNHASFALTAGANVWTFTSTSTGKTFTSNGKTCDFPLTFNGVGGGWTFQDAFTNGATRTLTLTNGALSFGTGLTHTLGFFSSSNANVRTFDSGTSTLNFPTTGTVWDTSTSTNLTMSGTGTIGLTANSATARTITGGSATLPNVSIATGSYAPTFTNCNFLSLTMTSGWSGTIANQTLTVRGNISFSSNGVYSSGANTWTWACASGTATWTTAGKSVAWPVVINAAGTHTHGDTFTSTSTITHTSGTWDLASYTISALSYSSSNSNVRTFASNTGTLTLTSTGVIFDCSTSTNMTHTGTGTIKLTDSSATARSISAGNMALCSVWVSAGTSVTTATNLMGVIDLNFTGMGAGTWTCNGTTFSISGSMTLVAAMTYSCSAALTFSSTAAGKTITTAGKLITPSTVTFDGVGGGWTLQDTVIAGSTIWTLTNGSLNTNNQAITSSNFSSSNSNVRSLTFGSTIWTLTGTGAVWDTSTSTNFTWSAGTGTLDLTNSTNAQRCICGGSLAMCGVQVSNGSGQQFFLNVNCNDLIFTTGFTGYWCATHDMTVRGSLTLPLNGTIMNGVTTITLAATSGTKTITSNGKTLNRHLTVNAPSGTYQLADALSVGSTLQPRTLTLTAGTLNAVTFAITANNFVSSNTNTRALSLGTATHTFTGSGTVWDITTGTNLTLTCGTSTLKFTDGSVTAKTFQGGGKTYHNVMYSGSGSGKFLTVGDNVFAGYATEKVA